MHTLYAKYKDQHGSRSWSELVKLIKEQHVDSRQGIQVATEPNATPPFSIQIPVDYAMAQTVAATDHMYDGNATCFAWDPDNLSNIY